MPAGLCSNSEQPSSGSRLQSNTSSTLGILSWGNGCLSSGEGPEEADNMKDVKTYREYAADRVRVAQSMDAKDRERLLKDG